MRLVSRAIRYRGKPRANVDEHLVGKGNGEKYFLLRTYASELECSLTLSCIHILKKAKQFRQKDDVTLVRNEEFCRLHQKFLKLVDKGRYKGNEFYAFLEDNRSHFNNKF